MTPISSLVLIPYSAPGTVATLLGDVWLNPAAIASHGRIAVHRAVADELMAMQVGWRELGLFEDEVRVVLQRTQGQRPGDDAGLFNP